MQQILIRIIVSNKYKEFKISKSIQSIKTIISFKENKLVKINLNNKDKYKITNNKCKIISKIKILFNKNNK